MRLMLLGPMQLVDDAGKRIMVAGPRQRILLAALAAHANQPVSLDVLTEVVWDGAPPAGRIATLRTHLARLRSCLGPYIAQRVVTRTPGYVLEIGDDELDLLAFEGHCRHAGAALRAADNTKASMSGALALSLWRGEPLSDVLSQSLRDMCVPRFERQRVQVAEDWIEAELRLGRHEQVLERLKDLSARYPLRERFHTQTMLALARSGRRAEALTVYQDVRKALVAELGVEPGPEMRAMHQHILSGECQPMPSSGPSGAASPSAEPAQRRVGSTPVVPRQLPAVPEHFTGRNAELDRLTAIARDVGAHAGNVVVCTIDGMAGIGKTALAVHWGHMYADRFPDGQLFADLRGFGPPGNALSAAAAMRGLLGALGIPQDRLPIDLQPLCALYRSVLADQRMLIVLDNARDAEQVRALLPGGAGCLVLVTSRNRLLSLTALEGARSLTVDALSMAESRQLLARRLGAECLAAEPQAANLLIELCARLPLALNIAAARAGTISGLPLATLVSQLHHTPDRLSALEAGDEASSLRLVLSWSYRALTLPAARLFRLLDAHPGPDLTAAVAASLTASSHAQALHALTELTGAHLLTEHVPGRYTFTNGLVGALAAEQANAQDLENERRAAAHRTLDHYLHSVGNAVMLLDPGLAPTSLPVPQHGVIPEHHSDSRDALAWLDAEHHILLAATTKAATDGFDTYAWQLAANMASLLGRHRHWHDLADILDIGLKATERLGDRDGQALAHRYLGLALAGLGDYHQAYFHFGRALGLVRRRADPVGQVDVHLGIAFTLGRQDRHRQAIKHTEKALALARAEGDRVAQARALTAISERHSRLGDYQRALTCTRQALDLLHEADSRTGEALVWHNRGLAHHFLNQHHESLTCYGRALDLHRRAHDRYSQSDTLIRLGDTHHLVGNTNAARDAWQQALAILEEIRHPDADRLHRKLNA